MKTYEAPTLTKVGSVAELTQGQLFQHGQDSLNWIIPVFGPPRNPGGPGNGGGFGS